MKQLTRLFVITSSTLALAACGGEEIASPGTGGNITINNPPAAPAPTPTPTGGAQATAATDCPFIADPQGLTDRGVISGPTGSYRLCQLPARFNRDSQLQFTPSSAAVIYLIDGQVDVGTDGGPAADNSDGLDDTNITLTIDPGVILAGLDASYLNVNRGNQIIADGTAQRPIIFTSQQNIRGENTDTSSGDWGGLILNGRAPITDCLGGATPGTVDCEREVEGTTTPPRYGGNVPGDSSGSVSFVQLRYSGTVLANGDELQALTTGGVGSGTNFENIMSFNSADDGVEFFGGLVNIKGLVVVGAEDDSIDTDTGVKANLQYVVAVQRDATGDTIIEADSSNTLEEDTPRQNTQISNATFIQRKVDDQVVRIRGKADYTIVNTVIVDASGGPTACLRIDGTDTLTRAANGAIDEAGPVRFESVVLDCATDFRDGSGGTTAAQVQSAFDAGSNTNSGFTNTLTMTYINGANEDAVAAFDATALSSFFDSTSFIGAAQAGDTRFEGWTCDSAAITFGNNSGSCTTLPVY